MPDVNLKELIEAGVHFGTRTANWNPKMKPYIHSAKGGIHIIDLRQTLRGLIRACSFLTKIAASGQKVLFVGTKRQAQEIVRQEATRAKSFFIVHRWLGGVLTNMETMRRRVARLEELEGLVTTGQIDEFSKKMASSLSRERKKVFRNFEGIRQMDRKPGAIVLVDPKQEHIALAEAMKLEVPVIALVDTDCDPEPVDFIIPSNDDSQRSIQALIGKLADAVIEGAAKAGNRATIAARAEETPAQPKKGVDVPENISQMGAFTMPD